jgi:hypothetical protein
MCCVSARTVRLRYGRQPVTMKNKADFPGRAPKGFRHPAPMAEKKSAAPRLFKAPPAFAEAMALHRAGRLAEAQEIYVRILVTQPDHFDSLHLLGVVHSQRGNYVEAVRQIDAALTINPKAAAALSNRGFALHELKQFGEAVALWSAVSWPSATRRQLWRRYHEIRSRCASVSSAIFPAAFQLEASDQRLAQPIGSPAFSNLWLSHRRCAGRANQDGDRFMRSLRPGPANDRRLARGNIGRCPSCPDLSGSGHGPRLDSARPQRLAPVQCNSWGHPDTSGFPTSSTRYFPASRARQAIANSASSNIKKVRVFIRYFDFADKATPRDVRSAPKRGH